MWHPFIPLIRQVSQGKEGKSVDLPHNPDKLKVHWSLDKERICGDEKSKTYNSGLYISQRSVGMITEFYCWHNQMGKKIRYWESVLPKDHQSGLKKTIKEPKKPYRQEDVRKRLSTQGEHIQIWPRKIMEKK